MEFELGTPDLSTPEGAKKALSDVTTAAIALRKHAGELEAKIGVLSKDLVTANQALTEAKRASVGHETHAADLELREFIGTDGKIRLKGDYTQETGWLGGLCDAQEPRNAWHREYMDLIEQRNLVRRVLGKGDKDLARTVSPHCDKRISVHVSSAPPEIRKAFGDISTTGAEWYPDQMLPMLSQTLKLERRVAALFGTMPMSQKNVILPFLTTGLRPYLKGAVAGDDPSQYTSSTPVTAQRTVDAVGFAVRTQMDEEAQEDAILDSMSILRAELAAAIVDGEEDAIINGCTLTHDDTGIANWNIRSRWGSSGLGTSADHRRAWLGLRARATDVSNTADGDSVQTTAGILTACGSLTSPHGVSGKPVIIMSPEWYLLKVLGLAEVLTVDKFGPAATVLTGQLASIVGKPIVLSEFIDAQLNASGVFDNTTKTKTGFIVVNPARFYIGQRRGSMVEIDKDITRGIYNLVSTVREIFFTVDPATTVKNVRWNYNLTAS